MRIGNGVLPAGGGDAVLTVPNAGELSAGRAKAQLRRWALALAILLTTMLVTARFRARALWREIGGRVAAVVLVAAATTALTAALFLPDRDGAAALAVAQPLAVPPLPALALRDAPTAPVPAIVLAPVEPSWVAVKRPMALFNLEAPDVEGTELAYRVMTRGKNARRDTMSWELRAGKSAPLARPVIHLIAERFEGELPTFRPLFPDLAARAAEQGHSIERMKAPGEIASKFGAVEIADAVLATEQGPLSCLLYRRIEGFGFTLSGWYCGTAQRPADRVSLACFIDRLDIVGGGQDRELKRHFAAAERARKTCTNARQPGRKVTWLDHEAPIPPLKLSAKAR